MAYYYVPVFVDTITMPDGVTTADQNSPGAYDTDGNTLILAEDLPGGAVALTYDFTVPRFVISCATTKSTISGWVEKTASDVNLDYPGLIP